MIYLAVVKVTPSGRVAKFKEFATEGEAEAHVVAYGGFSALRPSERSSEWMVTGTTLSLVPPDPEPELAESREREALRHIAGFLGIAGEVDTILDD
jgi:hypothetical protein